MQNVRLERDVSKKMDEMDNRSVDLDGSFRRGFPFSDRSQGKVL